MYNLKINTYFNHGRFFLLAIALDFFIKFMYNSITCIEGLLQL